MPDDRMFHKRLGHSEKVTSLSDLEFRVWTQYVLSADDFGVMWYSPLVLQAENTSLSRKPSRVVQGGLATIVRIGLARLFDHQGKSYVYQHDWQDFQHVRYPKRTVHPRVPDPELLGCTRPTQWLVTAWPGGDRNRKLSGWEPEADWVSPCHGAATVPEHDENGSALRARGGARNGSRLTATANANGEGSVRGDGPRPVQPSDNPDFAERAARFLERYDELHQRFRNGARYMGRIHVDYHEALQLVSVYDDERLESLATAFLNADDQFSSNGTRTIAKFRSRASWCDERLRERGL